MSWRFFVGSSTSLLLCSRNASITFRHSYHPHSPRSTTVLLCAACCSNWSSPEGSLAEGNSRSSGGARCLLLLLQSRQPPAAPSATVRRLQCLTIVFRRPPPAHKAADPGRRGPGQAGAEPVCSRPAPPAMAGAPPARGCAGPAAGRGRQPPPHPVSIPSPFPQRTNTAPGACPPQAWPGPARRARPQGAPPAAAPLLPGAPSSHVRRQQPRAQLRRRALRREEGQRTAPVSKHLRDTPHSAAQHRRTPRPRPN